MADVNLVVALRAEAEPLIERFGLMPRRSGAFPTFDSAPGDARSLRLVISGVGAIRAAAAVGYAHGLQEEAGIGAWLNVG
ncbi:MAG: hypothetical protein KDC38_14470, partial [Planctomycetes bacterium]|nr:hypothetical protein [Planctomycetota bacterium]